MVDLRPFLIPRLIKEARQGYKKSAQDNLRFISGLIKEKKELPTEAEDFLSNALHAISKEMPVNKAFYLNGRKNRDILREDQGIARSVYDAVKSGEKADAMYVLLSETGVNGKMYTQAKIKSAYHEFKAEIEAQEKYLKESYFLDC